MDHSERIVSEYLSYRGFRDVVYEPDGNVPPDFLLNGCVAVEVRRLNQNEETPDGPRGLEEAAIPLQAKVSRLLGTLGSSDEGESWYVVYSFRRPVPSWDELESALRFELCVFRGHSERRPTSLKIGQRFRLGCLEPDVPTLISSCSAAIPMETLVVSSSQNWIGTFVSAWPTRPRRSHAYVKGTRFGGSCS